jgi:UDP-2-acetamido-3-amino-2,3-dideoxy-glucuronate N-acetyltransferase
MSYFKHETALVDEGAVIGKDCRVWHWVHILGSAVIGERCSFGQNVYVGKAVLGNNVKVQNNVSIYDNVFLEDDVFCGPSMVFTNVRNPRSAVNRKEEYAATIIRKGATLGANSTIVCGVEIGAHAFIGAGTVVTKNVPAFACMVGAPAKQIGWMTRYGERFTEKDLINNRYLCPHTGDTYEFAQGQIRLMHAEEATP